MAASRALLVLATLAVALVGTAVGTDYTVGAPSGSWDLRTNYDQWVAGLTFRVGDRLVFTYSAAAHDVVEVTKANYDMCSGTSPISTVQTGNDIVPLTAAITRYFICSILGHCARGMKVQVKVEAVAAGGAPSPVNTPTVLPAPSPSTKIPSTTSRAPAAVGVGSLGGAVMAGALTMMMFN